MDDGSVAVRVHPTMVPDHHPLASVRDSFNAVFVEGDAVGELMFYGRGAGGFPTASAVLGDVVDAAANLAKATHASLGSFAKAKICPIDDLTTATTSTSRSRTDRVYWLRVAGLFGSHGVSIRSMEQQSLDESWPPVGSARLIFITHEAKEADVRATLHELRDLEDVTRRWARCFVSSGRTEALCVHEGYVFRHRWRGHRLELDLAELRRRPAGRTGLRRWSVCSRRLAAATAARRARDLSYPELAVEVMWPFVWRTRMIRPGRSGAVDFEKIVAMVHDSSASTFPRCARSDRSGISG